MDKPGDFVPLCDDKRCGRPACTLHSVWVIPLFTVLGVIVATLIFQGCSVQKMVIRSTSGLFDASFEALMMESDIELARTAIESDLKLLEGLILIDPENDDLLLLAATGFTSYALLFIEDEDPERAVPLYSRGRDYANRWLIVQTGKDLSSITRLDEFNETVRKLPASAVPGVFWMANGWASALNLNLADVASIADLPRVETMMQFVLDHDETYYYASAHMFFGAYYGSKPAMFGGDPVKAKAHFERFYALGGEEFLLGKLYEVKSLALPALDEEAARRGLQEILDFDLDKAPELRLPNAVAQKKAERLLEHLEDYL